jgi:hypothetical protein
MGIMLCESIKQSNQSTIRFKVCSAFCQPSHPMQICCPITIFWIKPTSFYYFTFKACSSITWAEMLLSIYMCLNDYSRSFHCTKVFKCVTFKMLVWNFLCNLINSGSQDSLFILIPHSWLLWFEANTYKLGSNIQQTFKPMLVSFLVYSVKLRVVVQVLMI